MFCIWSNFNDFKSFPLLLCFFFLFFFYFLFGYLFRQQWAWVVMYAAEYSNHIQYSIWAFFISFNNHRIIWKLLLSIWQFSLIRAIWAWICFEKNHERFPDAHTCATKSKCASTVNKKQRNAQVANIWRKKQKNSSNINENYVPWQIDGNISLFRITLIPHVI